MIPADNSPEVQKNSAPSAAPLERNGQNGVGKKESDYWPFDEPRPPRLTPEEIESLLQLWTEEDEVKAAEDLRDILENGGGVSSAEFLRAIEQAASGNG